MCGIIGYIGTRGATPLLLEGLKRMEYRGYDSAGVAVMNGTGVETRKAAGKISELERALATKPVEGDTGIGTHALGNPWCSQRMQRAPARRLQGRHCRRA